MFECNRNSYLVQFILFLVGLALISGKSQIFPAFCRWEEAQGVQGRWGAGGATHTLFVCLRINDLRISTPWGSIFLTA